MNNHVRDNKKALSVEAMFAVDGPLSSVLDDYVPRTGQQKMAAMVEQSIRSGEHLVVEAASGAGKTLAYLVPAILSGKKTIISTATQYLQHQLSQSEMSVMQKIVPYSVKFAVLKGRDNYICPYNLEKAINSDIQLSKNDRRQLARLWQHYETCGIQTWNELIPELGTKLIALATCSAHACLSQRCPKRARCPVLLAREKAARADIVIINHGLLFSDRTLRSDSIEGALFGAEIVIVDEAHRLCEFAQTMVGDHLSSKQLIDFCDDALSVLRQIAPEQRFVIEYIKKLKRAIHDIHSIEWATPFVNEQHMSVIDQLQQALGKIFQCIQPLMLRHQELEVLGIRAEGVAELLENIQSDKGLCRVEQGVHGFVLRNTPIDFTSLTSQFFKLMSTSWIFTSATLSVCNQSERFLRHLGLPDECFHRVSSDLNYEDNALLYIPRLPVDPSNGAYASYLAEYGEWLIHNVEGRVLWLFTSYQMLGAVNTILRSRNNECFITKRSVLVQGSVPNSELIERLRAEDNGLLMGTGSFWEGVDLSGIPLRAVIIDKLPFASPSDPLVKLRSEDLRRHGIDSFEHYLLPEAILRMRQGCGRLLRRLSDRGVIMVADPRLHTRRYGAAFIESLPPMPKCSDKNAVYQFLSRHSLLG